LKKILNIQYQLNGYTTGGTPRLKIVYTDSSNEYLIISGTSMTSYTKTTSSSKSVSSIQADFGAGSSNTLYLNSFIIAKGTSATYEPYGNGDWYLEKEIGKVIFNGTENWVKSTSYPGNYYCQNAVPNIMNTETDCISNLTNIFVSSVNVLASSDNCILIENTTEYKTINFKISSITTLDNFKTFLGNTNLYLYYQLLTPTYTKIEGTLKDELEAVWRAYSYKGQTNISQINNDLPFELDVSVKVGN
jgi:hypothetical protein